VTLSDPLLLAVDGGNSKTDLVLFTADGTPLSAVRGPGSSQFHLGIQGSMDVLGGMIEELRALAAARLGELPPMADVAMFSLAGADLPQEEEELLAAVTARGWARHNVVRNDTFAMLRAGCHGWGVAVVCGAGINGVGVGPTGEIVRFPALGALSGDWGGGQDVGMGALFAAVRGEDGRDEPTVLAESIAAYFGLPTAYAVTEAIYLGKLQETDLVKLPPLVFAAAAAGDRPAIALVERQAQEVVGFARAMIRRLGLQDEAPEVVLGGGLLRAGFGMLDDLVRAGILAVAPKAQIIHLTHDPLVGSAMMALDELGTDGPNGHTTARETFRRLYAENADALRAVNAG
jgi:N-acetylglucosamine kinase-like BadF-type ATPase